MKPVAQLTGYVNITSGDQDALTAAIATKGPISVAIDASHKSLSFYANGVYYEPQCGKLKICLLGNFSRSVSKLFTKVSRR